MRCERRSVACAIADQRALARAGFHWAIKCLGMDGQALGVFALVLPTRPSHRVALCYGAAIAPELLRCERLDRDTVHPTCGSQSP